MSDLHHEKHLESYIVQKLAGSGWLIGTSDAYDADRAMYPEDLEAWLRATQPQKWDRLQAMNGDKTLTVVMDRLETALEKQGMVQTLRRGFSIAGAGHLDLSEAAPEDRRNDAVLHRYASNRLRVVPQLKYHPGRELAIDLVLFLNGLPLATVELKTDFTQSVEHAKAQYRRDRPPVDPVTKRKHPLLTRQRGAVVHFAMSDTEIWMTTNLAGDNTFFLPFNKGNDGRAGNAARADGEYPVAYFWEEICQPDAFLRIFHSFVYVEKKNVVDLKGNWSVKETLMVVTSSRASAVRYKRAFDAFISANPAYGNIRALVAFSGKLTGREVMHPNDDLLKGDAFIVEEDAEFTEANMNPDAAGKDLRNVFDRPEYRVMLVANKFQTGFDQPKLVAMYVDKKIANAVEIVQTFSRLNRTFPGKDQTFIVDFINDADVVRAAFAQYDRGARIEEVQDLNVIYDLKGFLDDQGLYDDTHVLDFQRARFRTAAAAISGADDEAGHKAMFAATQEPTDAYNRRLSELRDRAGAAEDAWQRAKSTGNEDGMKRADHEREQVGAAILSLTDFKAALARFGRLYAYIAQLVDLGDPDLETFCAFSKLLANRLGGVPPAQIDLHGIALTGYQITEHEPEGTAEKPEVPILEPVKGGGSGGPRSGALPVYIQELIERLNSLFGEATPIQDQLAFVNQVAAITRENPVVMAQIDKNTKDQAMKGNLPGAVQAAVVRAMSSHSALATLLLSKDRQALPILEGVIYEILKRGDTLNLHEK